MGTRKQKSKKSGDFFYGKILKGGYHLYGQVVGGGVLPSFMNELCVFFG